MRVRRVAYVVNVFPKWSETFIANELAQLQSRGIELRILSLRPPGEPMQHEFIRACGLLDKTTYDPAQFSAVLRDFEPQLLHAHFATEPAAMAWKLSQEFGVRFTFTAHGYDIFRKPPADFHARATAASAVVTVSKANAAYLQSHFQVPSAHLRIIPCGVDTGLFKPVSKPPKDTPPLIVCVARHVVVKNLPLLLRACGILLSRAVPFRCVILGDGPCRQKLEALSAELGLGSAVQMPGAAEQREVLRWLQQADLAALSSENEGLPVCLMEAGACGLPVVATSVGGVPELIEHGITGLLTRAGDPVEFANALQQLLSEPALRSKMGSAARSRIEEFFSLEQQVSGLLELWKEILTRDGHSL